MTGLASLMAIAKAWEDLHRCDVQSNCHGGSLGEEDLRILASLVATTQDCPSTCAVPCPSSDMVTKLRNYRVPCSRLQGNGQHRAPYLSYFGPLFLFRSFTLEQFTTQNPVLYQAYGPLTLGNMRLSY